MSRIPRILAIDDDPIWLEQVPLILEEHGEVSVAGSIDSALNRIESEFFDVALLDLNFLGDPRTGMDVFRAIHALDRSLDVIVISGETNPTRLIQVFNAGVTRFIAKPATPDRIRAEVELVLANREAKRATQALIQQTGTSGIVNPLIGTSPAIERLRSEIADLKRANTSDILILGETGTGKELFARYLAHACDPAGRLVCPVPGTRRQSRPTYWTTPDLIAVS